MILYGTPVSTYTTKVRIALRFKGIAFEEREPPGGYRSAAWRERIPTGTIPALEVKGVLLAESEAILEFLEERHLDPPLLPGGPLERAHARRLARLHDLYLEPRVRALFPLVRDAARSPVQVSDASDGIQERLGQLARIARPGPYLAGAWFTLADCGHVVSVRLAIRLLEALGGQLELPASLRPWLAAAGAHPAVQDGLAPWQDAVEQWLTTRLVPTTQ